MNVVCVANKVSVLDKVLQRYAFAQDEDGVVDLTPGNEYVVYGLRENKLGTLYLVLTDTINTRLPWWMPAAFFEAIETKKPDAWQKDEWDGYGKEIVYANPSYFDAMEDIEDGTPRGYDVFEIMKSDLDDR